MTWVRSSNGLRLGRMAKGSPEVLVVLLHDVRDRAATLAPVAARWATTVPTAAFIALEGIEQPDLSAGGLPRHTTPDPAVAGGSTVLDRALRHLKPRIEQQLRFHRLDASRLVLVGFGYGGTLALHLLLHHGGRCAGVLAFAPKLTRPLPRSLRVDCKVRLIECLGFGHIDHTRSRDAVALLTARGIDTRGVLLAGPALSDEAVRHGGAYLVELVATAQRGNQFHVDRKNSSSVERRLPAVTE